LTSLKLDQNLIALSTEEIAGKKMKNREAEKMQEKEEPLSAASVMAKYALIWADSPKSKPLCQAEDNFSDA